LRCATRCCLHVVQARRARSCRRYSRDGVPRWYRARVGTGVIRPMSLSAAQVWYIAQVYPERVTHAEAAVAYEYEIRTETDRTYWEAAAKCLNDLATTND